MADEDKGALERELEEFVEKNMSAIDAGSLLGMHDEQARNYTSVELFINNYFVSEDNRRGVCAESAYFEAKKMMALDARKQGYAFVSNIEIVCLDIKRTQTRGWWTGADILIKGCGLKKKEEPEYEKGTVQAVE